MLGEDRGGDHGLFTDQAKPEMSQRMSMNLSERYNGQNHEVNSLELLEIKGYT